MATDEAALSNTDAGHVQQYTQMTSNAETARMSEPLAITEIEIGSHAQLLDCG